ncbi:hypothetical protein Tco_0631316 [Tanacetum coccineum]
MSSDTKITKDEECESVDSTKYQGMIGSLLYLTASRPDIIFSVCLCARFQEDPKTSHLEVVKRIFRYIKGTTHLGLCYPKESNIKTIVYANSNHAGDYVDRMSTSDITLSLSPITLIDHILDTPSPPSPQPPPQPPLIGHSIYFNMNDYHGRPSSLDSHETAVAQWRTRVAACPPSSDPSLLPSSTSIPSIDIAAISIIPALSTKFTATPYVLYTTPVHATSTHVISTIPSQTSLVGPSRKRCRDLVFDYEASIEADAKADSEANGKIGSEAGVRTNVEDEAYTKDYDTHIRTYIVVDVEAHAQIGVEAEIEVMRKRVGETIKIGVDMPTQRLEEIEEELRVQRERAEVAETERITLHARVRSLKVVETWLRGIVRDEREARARIECQLGLVQEELESLRDSRIS